MYVLRQKILEMLKILRKSPKWLKITEINDEYTADDPKDKIWHLP